MNSKALDLNHSINWLKAGKVLVHPTESIWGIGCDATNENAVKKIYELKKELDNLKNRESQGHKQEAHIEKKFDKWYEENKSRLERKN